MKRKANEPSICLEETGSVSLIETNSALAKTIYIIGEIDETVANETISGLLAANWEEVKTLNLYITSPGGFLSACFAITDMLLFIKEKYGVKINTFGLGEIASAGFFIFIAGQKRKLFPSCRVYVHTHITINSDAETYDQRLKADKHEEKEVYDNYVTYTAQQLTLTIPESKRLLKKQKWLTRKEIEKFNIGSLIDPKENLDG
jgi:ATP-dependent protease ClpP protease subunit